jgi:hypothetical protein
MQCKVQTTCSAYPIFHIRYSISDIPLAAVWMADGVNGCWLLVVTGCRLLAAGCRVRCPEIYVGFHVLGGR